MLTENETTAVMIECAKLANGLKRVVNKLLTLLSSAKTSLELCVKKIRVVNTKFKFLFLFEMVF